MNALQLLADWPVPNVAAAIVTSDRAGADVVTSGDASRSYGLASLTKPMVAWAAMIAVEERTLDLDVPLQHVSAPDGVTLRHLLAHASGLPFHGDRPIAAPARRRIYSNTGIEIAADELAGAAGMPFADYLREAVFAPLGMRSAELRGSPAHGAWCNVADTARFVAEMLDPHLVSTSGWREITSAQYPALAGTVPDVGRFDPCPWGLGVEIRGGKSPHWMGQSNSSAAFGHFGGSGTMMWVDPEIASGVVALTDRPFDAWRDEAMAAWPAFSDAVVAERTAPQA